MPQAIDFYFDFSSPYAYLGSERIDALAAKHNCEVIWRPYLMGAVFKQLGTSPLISQPVKGPYSRHDLARSARLYGIPFNIPDPFPVNSLAACRAYYWLEASDPARAKQLAQALYRGYFVDNRNLGEADIVVETAISLGIDKDAVTAALQDGDVKARLRSAVEAALDKGVFGAPFFIYGDQQFWGCDRMDHLDRWLETGGW
ncbi:MAG: 2-hydroxychromene-2-carboxylate isomerase [Proteobacteria bacterium]|nr:2-hydroxychromene-2-carboxylate isomerase [Pseudomonadota bacterium]MDA1355052.1 2-hydroxychromene-2-carboxylate isomerase [Pseudomonadota bacterium]